MKTLLIALLAAAPMAALAAQGPVTDAPVPAQVPELPSRAGPNPVPEQLATSPGTSLAGPANSTPFSAAPAGLLPNNSQGTSTRDTAREGGAASTSPSLSR